MFDSRLNLPTTVDSCMLLSTFACILSMFSRELLTVSCKSSIFGHKLSIVDCELSIVGCEHPTNLCRRKSQLVLTVFQNPCMYWALPGQFVIDICISMGKIDTGITKMFYEGARYDVRDPTCPIKTQI